jgi:hypothetical protein
LWAILQNENPVPIRTLSISQQSYSAILPKEIPVKTMNTRKIDSRFGEIDV